MTAQNPLVTALLDAMTDVDLADLAQRLQPHLADERRAIKADDLLNTHEAAAYLRTTRARIYSLRYESYIRPERDGKRLLFRRRELDRYLAERAGR